MNRSFLAVRLFLSMILGLMSATARAGAAEDAENAFQKFFPAFVAYNQDRVAAMFATDGQFYGTLSPQLVTTPEGVHAYFAAALNRPAQVAAAPIQISAKALSDTVVLIAGMWKVDRVVDGKTLSGGPYRVTAVMQRRGDNWTVVQFHNSPVPPPPTPAPAASR